ncbi:cold-shock protein [Shewanella colwelliana]|uniref:cold-shock protein n=1 Tax=Shewanella colwelliana TaxID=23 RepID=UPI001C7E0C07|nr:cold shock domain-containing protein [Shewanella colwelliana]
MKVFKGAITDWNKDKGFGFVRPLDGTDALFVHISSFGIKSAPPLSGQVVYFKPSKDKQGRRCATIVNKYGTPLAKKNKTIIDVSNTTHIQVNHSNNILCWLN